MSFFLCTVPAVSTVHMLYCTVYSTVLYLFLSIYTEYFAVTTFFHAWVRTKLYDSFTSIGILSTIETCFDCFGTRSSDDNRNNKKMTKPPGKFKSYAASLNPPPPPFLYGKGVSPSWGQCLKHPPHPPCG